MSESGSSFEKIEFEPLALNSLTSSDNESGDLLNSDQRLSSENSATTMASLKDQMRTMQLEDLEFELGWKTRDEIMCSLSQHTTLLSGLIIKEDVREKVCKANADLIVVLLNLPLKVEGRLRSIKSLGHRPNDGPNEVLLDLSSEARSRIVDTLMINHKLALAGDCVSNECKSKLIDRNNKLIGELVQLKSRIVSKEDPLIDQTFKASGLQTILKVAGKEEKLSELDDSNGSDGMVAAQKALINNLEENVRDLMDQVAELRRLDVCRNETTFTFKFKGIGAALAEGSTKELKSELFYLKGIPWFLSVRRIRVKEVDHLGIFLNFNDLLMIDRRFYWWSVSATYELRLLSSDTSVCFDVIGESKDQKLNQPYEYNGYGWPRFITIQRLLDGSFIQNDSIKIRAHLIVKNFEKINIEIPKLN